MSVHWPNVFAQSNGIEVPLLYGGTAALALTGFGAYSLDYARPEPGLDSGTQLDPLAQAVLNPMNL